MFLCLHTHSFIPSSGIPSRTVTSQKPTPKLEMCYCRLLSRSNHCAEFCACHRLACSCVCVCVCPHGSMSRDCFVTAGPQVTAVSYSVVCRPPPRSQFWVSGHLRGAQFPALLSAAAAVPAHVTGGWRRDGEVGGELGCGRAEWPAW